MDSSRHPSAEKPAAILAGFIKRGVAPDDHDYPFDELARLADTAGVSVAAVVSQPETRPTPQFLLGSGKIREIADAAETTGAAMVIFNHNLSPLQFRNLENEIGVQVIDRTQLILDIFAMRARSNEGKIQVELAQLEYLLPRMTGKGVELSRLGGGIGTRGPGETKLEVDKRRIRDRITTLKKKLKKVEKTRALQKRQREKSGIRTIALVGYTNAGKTTLFNRLAAEKALAEDKLFATLDPLTRKAHIPGVGQCLITDTVGFIRDLPIKLVESFKSTLEGVSEAHLLIHVVDVFSPQYEEQMAEVEKTIESLGAASIPTILALNKADMPAPDDRAASIMARNPNALPISALRDRDFAPLKEKIAELLQTTMQSRDAVDEII